MKQIKASDLKPCPFDGYYTKIVYFSDEDFGGTIEKRWYVKCAYCGAEGPHTTTKMGAVKSWNHRYKKGDLTG